MSQVVSLSFITSPIMCKRMLQDWGNGISEGLTMWPAFKTGSWVYGSKMMLSLILVLIWGGGAYKTQGTVLVFSWCVSGFIMPQIEKERQKERPFLEPKKGPCHATSEPSRQVSFGPHGYKGVTIYRYVKLQKRQNREANVFSYVSICVYPELTGLAPPICVLVKLPWRNYTNGRPGKYNSVFILVS